MDIEVRGGVIQLRPRGPEPSLDGLLLGITPENLHSAMDFGRPEGREAW
ncbi:MAG: AbrB/MazE/SpoVT family DNA-binding domain-containing protein [Gammaproteobacteria bacterium]